MLESTRMAKTTPLRLTGAICLVFLLGACAQARIVRRDFPDAPMPPPAPAHVAPKPAPPRHVVSTPPPVRTETAPRPVAPSPASPPEAIPKNETYIVKAGDTLYGVARRFGLKFKDVADWNRIAEPYAIQSGQRLHLHSPVGELVAAEPPKSTTVAASGFQPVPEVVQSGPPATAGTTAIATPSTSVPNPGATANVPPPYPASASTVPIASTPIEAAPTSSTTAPTTPKPQEAIEPPKPIVVVPPAVIAATPPTVTSTTSSSGATIPGGPRWRWPTDGEIVGRYVSGDQTQQGIDIAGHSGQPVIAAADGVIVYSGAGLVGYGELVIIKHSDEWLSAYAHNRRRLVAEGTKVKAGDAIAEMGRTGAISDMLHFEIRRNGKPVDPLLYLPKR